MGRLLSALNQLLGMLLTLVILGLVTIAGWFGFTTYQGAKQAEARLAEQSRQINNLQTVLTEKDGQITKLGQEVQAKQREIEKLGTAVRLLKVDHRLARIDVLSQTGSAAANDLATRLSFTELDPNGRPLESARVFTIKGDVVYLDAWVIKFEDRLVEEADPLRATSVCLFRRLFGEAQQPKEGFVLDQEGASPAAYRLGTKSSPLEQEIWGRFWEYANNPSLAAKAGVRAVHGEAPSIKLMSGKSYRVTLRASGGLTIAAEDAPATRPGTT